jgi:FAD/FMN-containing dehydrogenase
MKLSGWGRYPEIDAHVALPRTATDAAAAFPGFTGIPRGLGRSYGDSALADQVMSTAGLNHFLHFDPSTGQLRCGAGVSLEHILELVIPKGWFLPVTPGTKFVTVGGCIASDVHGKNHHVDGNFSEHVRSFRMALPSGELVFCSREENPDLFRAASGGMGLVGVITDAELQLRPIRTTTLEQTTIKARNLEEILDLFAVHQSVPYSVAWIDCLSSGDSLGRSLLMLGRHAENGALKVGGPPRKGIPVDFPGFVLNSMSIRAFNVLYYNRMLRKETTSKVHYDPFFYPLDGIRDWNRMYGKSGFTQYQFVLPTSSGLAGMKTILVMIAASGQGSFLAVLKAFGPENENYLSFPMEGITLALDFRLRPSLYPLLEELDGIVLDHGGRIYLTKDVRMKESTFKNSYPRWEQFAAIRERIGAAGVLESHQSRRLGI